MAERRMIALTMVDSDAFLELDPSAQNLYFHLNVRADDDGFVNKTRTILRMIGSTKDDLQSLIDKKFIIAFPDGVVVIKHWFVSNSIRKDRYTETKYQDDKAMLDLDSTGVYHLKKSDDSNVSDLPQPTGNQLATNWQPTGNQTTTNGEPDGNQLAPQVSKGKVSKEKDRLDKESIGEFKSAPAEPAPDLSDLFSPPMAEEMEKWIDVRSQVAPYPYTAITTTLSQAKRMEQKYGADACIKVIEDSIAGGFKSITWDRLEKGSGTRASPYIDNIKNRVDVVDTWHAT